MVLISSIFLPFRSGFNEVSEVLHVLRVVQDDLFVESDVDADVAEDETQVAQPIDVLQVADVINSGTKHAVLVVTCVTLLYSSAIVNLW